LSFSPVQTVGAPGQLIEVEVRVTTAEQIGLLQFTFEFDSDVVIYQSVRRGDDIPNFSVSNVNTNLPFPPSNPATDENVLVQLFGGGTQFFSGTDVQVAVITFQLHPNACATSPVVFDGDCSHTQAATGQGLMCDFALHDGSAATNCATDAPTATHQVQLLPNVPNPFNPMTTIRFELSQAGPADLRVFDVRGQLVRILLNDTLPAGAHELTWDGRDDSGRALPSGPYFYQLKALQDRVTRRMLMLK
jgi:hypothetical protein